MVDGIIGKKLGMTQIFAENGRRVPVTVIEAGPCRVVQIKTVQTDGYEAIQLGFGAKKRPNMPARKHAAKAEVAAPAVLREFQPTGDGDEIKPGQEIGADLFTVGELVDIAGISKGKGFQGVVRRYNFKSGPKTHGSMLHRAPGAIGMCAIPGKVIKGKRLPGHMGNKRRTVQKLKVVAVDTEKNLLLVQGAVPGAKSGILEIRKTRKGGR